ncbi:MAG: hypothetical protein C4545_00845 [Anaerolineaceae bacterium]|jgi:hypothetical protein|nr:MAG: hypothetical protein C4545_00845 [Anaerolineaceae bacterium]
MKKLIQILEKSDLLQKVLIAIFCFLSLLSFLEGNKNGLYHSTPGWQIVGTMNGIATGVVFIFLFLILFKKDQKVKSILKKLTVPFGCSKVLTCIICALLTAGIIFGIFIQFDQSFSGFYLRAFTIFLSACLIAGMLKGAFKQKSFIVLFLFSLLTLGCAYQAGNYLGDISSNPFSLGWSEGSRFYYSSLLFSEKLYGQKLPLSFLHPSRYVILSLPFLLSNAGIFIHRAWQVFLWIATTGLCMLGIVRRLRQKDFWWNAILVLSGFLFLQQGPVYYHLLISAILILFGFHREKFWQSTLVVVLASCWAGISRINWYPLPGVLAAMLYFFETSKTEKTTFFEYIKQPFFFIVIGLLFSFLTNVAYIPLSGNSGVENFTTSFTSDLLWNRLLPGPTFPKGILTGTLWLNAPLILLLIIRLPGIKNEFGWIQRTFLIAALAVFFIGGLFVSVKIGGGSNLHNMDAFMLLLLISVYYLVFSEFYPSEKINLSNSLTGLIVICLFLQPFFWALTAWTPRTYFSAESLQHDLSEINGYIESINSNHPQSDILFINQRQLLTFGYVTETALVPEYELLELMEMAISNQDAYLEKFYEDLAVHKYELIVINKQYLIFKGEEDAFPEENNAWVKNISIPLMKYYTPVAWLRYTDTEIYVPRPENELQRLITQ